MGREKFIDDMPCQEELDGLEDEYWRDPHENDGNYDDTDYEDCT